MIVTHLIRNEWLNLFGGIMGADPVLHFGTRAPEAYRIGLPILWHILIRLFHYRDWTLVDATVEFTCCFLALGLLYSLTVEGLETPRDRIAALAMFLALVQFPFAFLLFRMRPDTLTASLFVAAALFCVSRPGPRWTAALLLAALLQSFMRADVPFVLGLALALISARNLSAHAANFFRGLGAMLIAGCVQLYLQFILMPHLPYSSKVVMFWSNFSRPQLTVFFLALTPFILALLLLRPSRIQLREMDRLAIAASALYLPLWFTVGVVMEVRIFIPFLLALCVVAARGSSAYLANAGRAEVVATEK